MQEQDGDGEPAHHARRPMNAFLIFCKRHRSVVRDKYPNLENRSITKILGEWWANLDKDEKACYTGLAKQYKDAFFSANPDFKWYKLPAPPLRTLAARPREHDRTEPDRPERTERTERVERPQHYAENDLERTNNNSTKLDLNKKSREYIFANQVTKPLLAMFTPGKLADEAQMGQLSRLLDAKTETQTDYKSDFTYRSPREAPRENSIRDLQNALSETTRVFEDLEEERMYNQDSFTNQDVIDQIVDKRYSDEYYRRTWSDDERGRSGRSCKGKRYQEFMAVGGLIVNKRARREGGERVDDGYPASSSWDGREDSATTEDSKQSSESIDEPQPKQESTETADDNNANKAFKAADFDLDAKIAALPSLSLEKFQQRKRENKRRKKTINLKPKALTNVVNSGHGSAESWRDAAIGSQKRKPRKISITRFEPSSLIATGPQVSPELKLGAEAPLHPCDPCGDLMALATLAEVAASTAKLVPQTASKV